MKKIDDKYLEELNEIKVKFEHFQKQNEQKVRIYICFL